LSRSTLDTSIGEELAFMPVDYLPILILVIVATAFACLALIVPTLLGPRRPTETKLLPYESGKIPFGDARRRFPVKYYLTAMLFIVLDIAVIFLYPWATIFRDLEVFGLIAMAIFVIILLVGYIYIWKKGALEWD
jgi:NADH-quinone oxidoreductase subunit A